MTTTIGPNRYRAQKHTNKTLHINHGASGLQYSSHKNNLLSTILCSISLAFTSGFCLPVSAQTAPQGYILCANENEYYYLNGPCDVAYGANGKFYYKNAQTGFIKFNNSIFGDPIHGVVKNGFFKPTSPYPSAPAPTPIPNPIPFQAPDGFIFCADADQSYVLSQMCDVAYGVDGIYHYQFGKTGTVTFNDASFGYTTPSSKPRKGYYKPSTQLSTLNFLPTPDFDITDYHTWAGSKRLPNTPEAIYRRSHPFEGNFTGDDRVFPLANKVRAAGFPSVAHAIENANIRFASDRPATGYTERGNAEGISPITLNDLEVSKSGSHPERFDVTLIHECIHNLGYKDFVDDTTDEEHKTYHWADVIAKAIGSALNCYHDDDSWFTWRANEPSGTTPRPCISTSVQPVSGDSFTIYAHNVNNATSVCFPTWTDANGQDDLRWVPGNYDSVNNCWTATINIAEHNYESGAYVVHVYATDKSGNQSFIGYTSVSVVGPTISASSQTVAGKTFEIYASHVRNAKRVQFPIWSDANGQDDLRWEEGVYDSVNDRWVAKINIADHNSESGRYTIHVYETDNFGGFRFIGYTWVVVLPPNVALNKPTNQSSIAYGGDSSRAADGNTNGTWSAGSVTHTDYDSEAWWQVNLGAPYRINKVTLYNRTDSCGGRLSNFHVDYLDASGRVIAKQDYPGTAGAAVDINLAVSGVYSVRVQLYGTNNLSLAEVQVFGTR